MCLKISRPHKIPNLRGQLLFLDIKRKDFRFVTYFVQHVFRNSQSFSRYLGKEFLGADPIAPYRGHLKKKLKCRVLKIMILNNFCSIMLFKMFVVFVIYEVKDLSFWPLKSLIT